MGECKPKCGKREALAVDKQATVSPRQIPEKARFQTLNGQELLHPIGLGGADFDAGDAVLRQ